MIWVIYVSDKPHSKKNFAIGLDKRVWGVKDSKKETIEKVTEGDLVAFVYSISWLKDEGAPPKGFSRVSKENIDKFRGAVQSITLARVSKSYYTSEEEVWPDDDYPHRFDFDSVETLGKDVFFGTEFFNTDFVEAVRYSACTQGSVTQASGIKSITDIMVAAGEDDEQEDSITGSEGRPILRLHLSRERDSSLVKKKKQSVLDEHGKLECEICAVDFKKVYGELGDGFAECHHTRPLSHREDNEETKLKDLAIVCANCHRMLHRRRPWLTVDGLKKIYEEHRTESATK
ncbi:HNH endonuclease [Enterobacter quasiroggenkampii]|uniref:HNH endonuclease n=1 Tax=Enterobacter TaxID=547 RepID=UPI0021D02DE5|nr:MULTISPECIES: HNH endonuclease [Enterobacter]MCU6328321.1 HNH endonuclease [Enterobacter quasiroggenkampii]MEB6511463.1 HNH endonuclease [Enterobacter roggenkampii]